MIPLLLLAAAPMGSPQSITLRGGFQDTAGLDRAVASFTGSAIGAEGGARAAIDQRLRLASCPTVALSWRGEAHDAVVVTCSGPDWRIFVPVRRSVAVASAAPSSGFAPRSATPTAAKAAPVIHHGDPVLIEAGDAGFQITREGIAAADAAPGMRVGVRVAGATQLVQAVAVGDGRVTLPGWAAIGTEQNR